jgi:WhiB family transcriptional regulator, redox-sensing transcriptional regulator
MAELRAVPDLAHQGGGQSWSWSGAEVGIAGDFNAEDFTAADIGSDFYPGSPEWQERALCAQTDPEAFFPEKGGSTREAKKICLSCDVRDRCLEYALQHDERFGIWGGLSERERRRLKRQVV